MELEIYLVKKGKYLERRHSLSVKNLTEDEVNELSKIIYDQAKFTILNKFKKRIEEEE
ncbi:MAG: hypothetical protein ACE5K0_00175 [Candidatus Methanofastidiosia archaeon]